MSAAELLSELQAAGVELTAQGGTLHVKTLRPVPLELLARGRAAKPALLELLTAPAPLTDQTSVSRLPPDAALDDPAAVDQVLDLPPGLRAELLPRPVPDPLAHAPRAHPGGLLPAHHRPGLAGPSIDPATGGLRADLLEEILARARFGTASLSLTLDPRREVAKVTERALATVDDALRPGVTTERAPLPWSDVPDLAATRRRQNLLRIATETDALSPSTCGRVTGS